jgi:hypothetical protein
MQGSTGSGLDTVDRQELVASARRKWVRTTMRRASRFGAVSVSIGALLMVTLGPRPANASDSGGLILIGGAIVLGLGGADLAFTGYDLVQAVSEERASKGMATAEIMVAAPQFLFGSLALTQMRYDNQMIAPAFYVVWMGVLAGHGMVTLGTTPPMGSEPPAPPPEPDTPPKEKPKPAPDPYSEHPHFSLAPTVLSDGRGALVPGFCAVGTF